ncbi:MAG: hypothetical protein UT53_C0014G0007 [Candidatus Yanofskybacteria bacterium GW2011_GWD2_39_48]|uniref:Uncharacterized protein n=1 Tax=Candidatus Yanofskybacteria bacterium GW2011_GWD2_39_48 TaxID=1619031 RepID=A0A0G0P5K2_9BACT|nr:MAG: hypothetical protein UT53_C0014G0007 [Candidatus Yanofskybacteria bacterium GW2011_GWD2_39_48]
MSTKKELLAENKRLKRKLKKRKTSMRPPSEDEIRDEARRLQGEREYHEIYMDRLRRGQRTLCLRIASNFESSKPLVLYGLRLF